MTDEIAARRASKETDNIKVAPTDLLNSVLAEIARGNVKGDGLYIMVVDRWENGNIRSIERYRLTIEEARLVYDAMDRDDNIVYRTRGEPEQCTLDGRHFTPPQLMAIAVLAAAAEIE